MTKEEFIKAVQPYADKAGAALGVPGSWVAAQWAHETGYKLNSNNNLAGLYAYPTSPYGPSGKRYGDLNQFTAAYIATVSNSRYTAAREANDVWDFARELQKAGYASDLNYGYAKTWGEATGIYAGLKASPGGSRDAGSGGWLQSIRNFFHSPLKPSSEIVKDMEKAGAIPPEAVREDYKDDLKFQVGRGVVLVLLVLGVGVASFKMLNMPLPGPGLINKVVKK